MILFRGALIALLLSAWFVAIAPTAHAKLIVTEKTKTYKVRGKTGKQLMRSIVRRGLKASNTRHAMATTQTKIKVLNVDGAARRGRCVAKNVRVQLDLIYTYPKWVDRDRASPALRKAWDRFMARVVRHEQKHGKISKAYAVKLERAVRRSKGSVSKKCKDFGKRQLRKMARERVRVREQHARFDRRESRVLSRVRRLQKRLIETN